MNSEELKSAFQEIKEFIIEKLIGRLKKSRIGTQQEGDLETDEREMLKIFFDNEYQENILAKGAPDSDEAKEIFSKSLLKFVSQELKREI